MCGSFMRSSIVALVLCLTICACVIDSAMAALDNIRVTVEGTITGVTCKADGGLVELPKKSRRLLAGMGSVAGKTLFKVTLEQCPENSLIFFQADNGTINSDGRLINTVVDSPTEKRAENVELEVLNAQGAPMNLAATDSHLQGSSAPDMPLPSDPDKRVYSFYVQYYATGAATVGQVKSSVTFIVESP